MSTLSRALGKAFQKSLDTYHVYFEQVSRCSNAEKPAMPKTHPKVREKLDSCYVGLCTDWIAYKRDIGLSDTEFNAMEGDVPVIEHNDSWYNKLQEDYYDLCEKSDNVLEMQQAELSSGKVETEIKVDPEELKLRQNKNTCFCPSGRTKMHGC